MIDNPWPSQQCIESERLIGNRLIYPIFFLPQDFSSVFTFSYQYRNQNDNNFFDTSSFSITHNSLFYFLFLFGVEKKLFLCYVE